MSKLHQPNDPPPPREHQVEALNFMGNRRFVGLFMDPGTGKTRVSIDHMVKLYLAGEIDTALIMAPNGVHEQWLEEQVPMHIGIPYRQIAWSANRTVAWKNAARSVLRKKDYLTIISMNHESLTTKNGLHFCRYVLGDRKVCLYIDESSRIRNPNAIRTRTALEIAPLAKYRVILTGTPTPKGVENLWSQMQFLSPDILKMRHFVQFRSHYCKLKSFNLRPTEDQKRKGQKGRKITSIDGYQNVEELMGVIDPYIFRKRKEDCLDLPDKILVNSPVPLTTEQKKAYLSMREQLIVELSELEVVTVAHVVSARAKLRQIAIGFILDKNRIATPLPSDRWERALEHIEEAPGQVILWTSFRWCLSEWEQRLKKSGVGYVRYQKGDNESIRRWKKDKGLTVFLGNPHSGGIGLNLANAGTMIFFNNIDDAEIRWQSEDRAHRMGQTEHLHVIDMFAPGTLETKIRRQQIDKETVADIVMKRGWIEAL